MDVPAQPDASHRHDHHDHQAGDLAELLDLDAAVLHAYWAQATGWVRRLAWGTPRRRILDLGAGTGTGTIALAQRFGSARVTALDVSEPMLARIRTKALDLGLAQRVRTVRADLDADWPALEPVDLVWASLSLHELRDPGQALVQAFATLRPGGLMAVAEMDAHLRFLPEDLGMGEPGLEARCLAALGGAGQHAMPFGSDWGPSLARASFEPVDRRTFPIALAGPHAPATGRYARGWLRRVREAVEDRIGAEDLAVLATLLDDASPDGVLRREDLLVRGSRTVWVARRP
jgi:SAM-dependent methyltransferase